MTSSDILGCKDSPQILFDNIICYSKTWLLKVKIWNTNNTDMLSYLIKLFSLTISTNFVLPTAVWNFVLIGSSQSKHDECFLVLIIISWTLLDASPNQSWQSSIPTDLGIVYQKASHFNLQEEIYVSASRHLSCSLHWSLPKSSFRGRKDNLLEMLIFWAIWLNFLLTW